jgi:O-antigen ligase
MGFLAALYGFLTYIGLDVLKSLYPFEFEAVQGGGRNYIHSFYGNPEYFGGVAAPTAILLLGLGLAPKASLIKRALWTAASAFIILVLLLSGSRGALFGFALGAAIVFFGQVQLLPSKLRRISWAALGAALLVVAAGLVIFSTPNPINRRDMRLAQRFTTIFETSSASTRERILFYTSTAMAIPQNPVFGYGPGTYRLEFFNNVKLLVDADPRAGTTMLLNALDRRLAEHTHNDYLEFWFEQGTIGIALLLLLIVHGGVRFLSSRAANWRQRETSTAAPLTAINVTLFAATVTILVNAATSFPLHMPARGTLAWVLIGAFFASDRALSEARKSAAGSTKSLQNDEKVES